MPSFIALLRAVNLGPTNKLPMTELKTICETAGFEKVKTYIASGNVIFTSPKSEIQVKKALEKALGEYAGKPVSVLIRTAAEMAAVVKANPFEGKPGNWSVAIFLDEAPPSDTLDHATGIQGEEIRLGKREIYAYYTNGIGESRLKIPAAKHGTGRNMNTVAKLAEMAAEL